MATNNPSNAGAGTGLVDEAGTAVMGEQAARGGGVTGAIGTRLERAGNYLEEKGKAAFLSDRLHGAGRYLQEHDMRSITRSVDSAICAHPYRSMLIGVGIGWLIGRFVKR